MPAKLGSTDFISIEIVGYQFPDAKIKDVDDYYDANWLNIQILVKKDKYVWHATDPSLLTDEVQSIADWFFRISEGKRVKRKLEFMEQTPAFEIYKGELKIYLSRKYKNPFTGKSKIFSLKPSKQDLRNFANDLLIDLSKFPLRK